MRVNKDVVQMERSRHNRGGNMPGLHPLAAEYTTKEKRIELYGILKGQKQLNDIPEVW